MSRKSGIFNFIKLPNLMVGLVAACVCFACGDAHGECRTKASGAVENHFDRSSGDDYKHYHCGSNYCGTGDVVITLDSKKTGLLAYARCSAKKDGGIDRSGWKDLTMSPCDDVPDETMYAKKKVDNAAMEVYIDGVKMDGSTTSIDDTSDVCFLYKCNLGKRLSIDGNSCEKCTEGATKTETCPDNYRNVATCKRVCKGGSWSAIFADECAEGYPYKRGTSCGVCDINDTRSADCDGSIPGAAECEEKCMEGEWRLYVKSCLDTHRVVRGGLGCQLITQPQVTPETTPANTTTPADTGQEQDTTASAASSGGCNTQESCTPSCVSGAESVQFTGKYCMATKCRQDFYKVKNARGVYQGWCIYKKCNDGQHVDTGTDGMVLANDIKCVADTPTGTETKVETSGDTNTGTSAATTAVETTSAATPAGPADGEECNKPGARQAEYRNGKCIAMECDDGYEPSGDNCVEISGPCESLPAHAVRGHREYNVDTGDVECIIDDCDDDYVVADDKLSCHEDYDAQAKAAREREQSTGNKLIGALGMGATGIGGSMLMSGLAESAADDDAERAMTAYLETFTCKYGNESVSGGTMNVEIPGGNELINMYSEYVALANDLKLRKAALGMKPGIESEPILDSATSGLYDDVGTGRGKGVYASLARALENPDGEDAKAWAAQREESEKKKKTGAIVAGIGAVGSLIGNVAINADWGKNKHKALRDLEEDVNNIRPSRDRCPDDADGTYAPDCDCSGVGRVYNANMNRCDACPSGMIARNNSCECPQANQIYMSASGQCVDMVAAMAHVNKTLADTMLHLQTAVLSADAMFAYGRYELRPEAQKALDEFINNLRNVKSSNCKVNVVGYADPSPIGSDSANKTLSQNRAKKVAYYLRKNVSNVIVEDEGKGEANCTCGLRSKIEGSDTSENGYVFCKDKTDNTIVPDGLRYAPCRRVEIQMQNCELESDVTAAQGAGEFAGSVLSGLTAK